MSAYADLDLFNTIGATNIGFTISSFLGGLAFQQAIDYFKKYPNDRLIFKGSVLALTILNLFHTASVSHINYTWTVTYFNDPAGLDAVPVSFGLQFFGLGLITLIVQDLYAYRIYVLSGRWWLALPAVFISLFQFAFCVVSAIFTFNVPVQSRFSEMLWGALLWIVSAVVGDFYITITLITFLQMSKGAFNSTNNTLNRLSLLILQTNTLTAFTAITVVVIFAVLQNGWNNCLNFILAKLYVISYLASVNSRPPHEGSRYAGRGFTAFTTTSLFKDGRNRFQNESTHSQLGTGSPEYGLPLQKLDNLESGVSVQRQVAVTFDRSDDENLQKSIPYHNIRKATLAKANGNNNNNSNENVNYNENENSQFRAI